MALEQLLWTMTEKVFEFTNDPPSIFVQFAVFSIHCRPAASKSSASENGAETGTQRVGLFGFGKKSKEQELEESEPPAKPQRGLFGLGGKKQEEEEEEEAPKSSSPLKNLFGSKKAGFGLAQEFFESWSFLVTKTTKAIDNNKGIWISFVFESKRKMGTPW